VYAKRVKIGYDSDWKRRRNPSNASHLIKHSVLTAKHQQFNLTLVSASTFRPRIKRVNVDVIT